MLDLIRDWIWTSEDLIALKFLDLISDCSNLCSRHYSRCPASSTYLTRSRYPSPQQSVDERRLLACCHLSDEEEAKTKTLYFFGEERNCNSLCQVAMSLFEITNVQT